ncbi:MAG: SDR family NAD(P)-dependent oxidoreductase [Terriglobia bacterium]
MTDRGGVGEELGRKMKLRGGECVMVWAGRGYRELGEGRYEIGEDQEEEITRLIREEGSFRGVVYLWGLEEGVGEASSSGELSQGIRRGCGGLLHLVKGLVGDGETKAKGLWVVTRGAQSVGEEAERVALAQAPVWGLGSAIALEYPELRCVRVDLDPGAGRGEVERLMQEIESGKGESQVAMRGGVRQVARLVRSRRQAGGKEEGLTVKRPCRLEIEQAGVLDNLRFQPLKRRDPGPGEVEIEVIATGLNFRDVLIALGKYPGTSDGIGYEFSARIVRLGSDVKEFTIGDKVMGIAPGSFASHLTVQTDLLFSIPDALGVLDAAAIPSAFLTAAYALNYLAKMMSSDRVLIHAAAGGVGLAAVQLAQRAGAGIFATAGSEQKRAFLKSMGVTHVMNSRTLEFADEIMEKTAGQGVDIVLNSLAGEFIPKSLSVLSDKGRFLEIGMTGIWDEKQVASLKRSISYYPINLAKITRENHLLVHNLLKELIQDFDKGQLRPLPLRVFPLEEVAHAFRFMAQAKQTGKIAVSFEKQQERQRTQTALPSVPASKLDPVGAYMITGGLSGLGLLVAEWMVENGARHIVLMGRSKVTEAAQPVIQKFREDGVEVEIIQGDVTQQTQLKEVFGKFGKTLPALKGLIHSAGALDDGVLTQQNWGRFQKFWRLR